MRLAIVASLAVLLAGCGNSEDFAVDVPLAPDRAKAQLARIDGGAIVSGLSLTPIVIETEQRRELMFHLKGDAGEGELHMWFDDADTGATRIRVALSLPAAETTIDGAAKVLSESKAEDALEAGLKEWAERQGRSGYASLDPLNQLVGGMVLALTPGKMGEMLAAADDPAELSGLVDPGVLSELEEGEPEFAVAESTPEVGRPMTDTRAGTEAAAQPMNLAQGVDPRGVDPTPNSQSPTE